MELIATHISADFDALASVLAARRLFPRAEIFFPGSREESVRRMLDSGLVSFEELRQRQIDPSTIERVILCDVRQRDRIGILAAWLDERPEIEVLVYDHHPESPGDVATAGGLVDPSVGSTSTLMVEELRRRGLEVPADEATVLMMGIHEDTGSLTFPTATPRDYAAAAWLLGRGADLGAVRRFAVQRLDAHRIEILHRMIQELAVFRVHDHRVGMVAVELGEYVDELAPLVNRCLEIFELDLIFALFGEADRVTIIARGEVAGVDLGNLLAGFADGGGHATAAAARLKGATALEARERLLAHLERTLPPVVLARDLMIERFFRLPASVSIAEAKEALVARRVNAAPVVDAAGRPVGGVTRQLLDAALQHDLGDRPVERVMAPELEWVPPTAAAEEIARRILDRHSRFVLVGDRRRGEAAGLVTRMDVLRHLYGRLAGLTAEIDRRTGERRPVTQGIARLLHQRLDPAVRRRGAVAARVSRDHDLPVYLVGGLVRDLLLDRENRDLDLVVEGDGIAYAQLLAKALDGRVRAHEAFQTAVVVDAEGFHIDIATARSEFYRSPAALPEVERSTLRQDLYRRDFTVNTLAVRLGPNDAPELVDHFGGGADLKDGVLRVLHSLSFVDDPTRVLRAVRLELRLGFAMSPETLRLVRVALEEGVFGRLSGARLRDELRLLLGDPALVLRAVERLAELGLLAVLEPELTLTPAGRERLRRAVAAHDWYRLEGLSAPPVSLWLLCLMALAADLTTAGRHRLADRLQLGKEERELLGRFPQRLAAAREVLAVPGVVPHRVSAALKPLTGEELLLLLAAGDEAIRAWVRRDLTEMRRFRLTIRGRDLLATGARPGKWIGAALEATHNARLDGEIGPEDELGFALAALERQGIEPAPQPVAEGGRR